MDMLERYAEDTPPSIDPNLILAVPQDGRTAIAIATSSLDTAYAILKALGYSPSQCTIGSARLASMSLVEDWCTVRDVTFNGP